MRAAALSNNQRCWFSFLARKVAGIVRINSGRNEMDVYSRRESRTRNRIVRRSTLEQPSNDLPETRKSTFRSIVSRSCVAFLPSFVPSYLALISASAICMPFDLAHILVLSRMNERTCEDLVNATKSSLNARAELYKFVRFNCY